jgi:lysophospholipase L1-like esterase
LDHPSLQSLPLPEERAGLIQPDRTLFWSLRPDTHAIWQGTQISVNHEGTRGDEIEPKQPGELRILSLGESTTFGSTVSDDDTYSARLEALLQAAYPNRHVTVINAGVPAYSSFQSLTFLEQRGFALQPDLVLFSHELNDYLPTSLRDSSNNEIGLVQTDRQLYESRAQRGHRALMQWSAVYRWLSYALANARIRKFDRPEAANPILGIGLPGYELPSRVASAEGRSGDTPAHNDKALGRRVSDEERRANLEQLTSLCRARGVQLVLLHPSYRDSFRHECLLTRFAAERGVLMFDEFDSLHPPDVSARSVFNDAWHPGPDGHAWLAKDLARFLAEHVPAAPVRSFQ